MLKEISKKQLNELQYILNQVNEQDYNRVLSVLENGTLGRHTRHILEFHECLFAPDQEDIVCYDDRKRNLLLEENIRFASDYINELCDKIDRIDINKRLLLRCRYEGSEMLMESSLFREIIYTIEHTVHHLAIIRIAISSELKYIRISENFGYADSTIRFLTTQKIAG